MRIIFKLRWEQGRKFNDILRFVEKFMWIFNLRMIWKVETGDLLFNRIPIILRCSSVFQTLPLSSVV